MRPSVLEILRALALEGDAGLQAGQIAALFDEPADQAVRNRLVNNHLSYIRPKVRRSKNPEPSLRYNKVPVYRWWITEEGRKYLEAGGWAGLVARSKLEKREREGHRTARLDQQRALLGRAGAMAAALPPGCRPARNALVKELYGGGLTLEKIGDLVGLTRERVRQIAVGKKNPQRLRRYGERPCQCSLCRRARLEEALADLDDPLSESLGALHLEWQRFASLEDASP